MEEIARVEGEIVGLLELLKTVDSDDLFEECVYEETRKIVHKLNYKFEIHEHLIRDLI